MKSLVTFVCLVALTGVIAGCNQSAEAPSEKPSAAAPAVQPAAFTGHPLGSVKVGDSAVCAVCAVREGTSAKEEVKATLDYKGKTYAFCSEEEKAVFISNPARYAGAQKACRGRRRRGAALWNASGGR